MPQIAVTSPQMCQKATNPNNIAIFVEPIEKNSHGSYQILKIRYLMVLQNIMQFLNSLIMMAMVIYQNRTWNLLFRSSKFLITHKKQRS